jgi:hypothetical protein
MRTCANDIYIYIYTYTYYYMFVHMRSLVLYVVAHMNTCVCIHIGTFEAHLRAFIVVFFARYSTRYWGVSVRLGAWDCNPIVAGATTAEHQGLGSDRRR